MQKYKNSLFFSPAVILGTFITELLLAGYVIWRYKWDKITKFAVTTLVLLATVYPNIGALDYAFGW